MFRLKECGEERSDCTTSYDVILDRPYTVAEFVDEVLKRKRRGRIGIYTGSWCPSFTSPYCKYCDDKLLSSFPDEYLNREVFSARADGGWGTMDYILKLKEEASNNDICN